MENYSTTCNSSLLQKTDIYVIIAFFLFGGIKMTFIPAEFKAALCSTVYLSIVVSAIVAILSPVSVEKRLLKAIAMIFLTTLGAVLGGSLCIFSVPLSVGLITKCLYSGNPKTYPVEEHEKNMALLNIAYLIVAVLSLIVVAGVAMYHDMEYYGNGLDWIAGYFVTKNYDGDLLSLFSSDTENKIQLFRDFIVSLFILMPIATTIASFLVSKRNDSPIYIFPVIPSYFVLFLAFIMTINSRSNFWFMNLFGLGFHQYFILSHVAALIAIARNREVKLLHLQEERIARAKWASDSSTDTSKVINSGTFGFKEFILAALCFMVLLHIIILVIAFYIEPAMKA
jgi:hypothetical protein